MRRLTVYHRRSPVGRWLVAAALAAGLSACQPAPFLAPVEIASPPDPEPAPPEILPEPEVRRPDEHIVSEGETLTAIALNYGLSYRDLAFWNDLRDPNHIRTNQRLRLRPPENQPTTAVVMKKTVRPLVEMAPADEGAPASDSIPAAAAAPTEAAVPAEAAPPPQPNVTYIGSPDSSAAATESVEKVVANAPLKTAPVASRYDYSEAQLAALRQAWTPSAPAKLDGAAAPAASAAQTGPSPAAVRRRFDVDWSYPTASSVAETFNESRKGINFVDARGAPVYAVADGKVIYVGTGVKAYGRLVIIKHENDYLSAYAHNSEVYVKEGNQVKRGMRIAAFGDSGSDKVMLHLEIRKGGKPIDPLQVLPAKP